MSIDQKKYIEFVKQTTSVPSSNLQDLFLTFSTLSNTKDANVPHLLTAALGVSAESGELVEIIKKVFLQGKPYNEDTVLHLKKEAGDVLWYISQLCIALGTDFDELMQINYEKLSARYPEGTFDVYKSENRVEGDL
jgi:NTP pyrophosphatase (non-canonical NTP hydrolase)